MAKMQPVPEAFTCIWCLLEGLNVVDSGKGEVRLLQRLEFSTVPVIKRFG